MYYGNIMLLSLALVDFDSFYDTRAANSSDKKSV